MTTLQMTYNTDGVWCLGFWVENQWIERCCSTDTDYFLERFNEDFVHFQNEVIEHGV